MGNNQVTIRIAGVIIGIEPLNEGFYEFCKDYISDEEADFVLRATEADLAEEQKKVAAYMDGEIYEGLELEKLWMYRQIAETIPKYEAFLIHATAIRVDRKAYLLIGPSGAGKTTHARLWKKYLGERMLMINDDKPIIRLYDGRFYACASPWSGKDRWMNNIDAPLHAIIRIKQAEQNRIEEVPDEDIWEVLMNQIYKSSKHDTMQRIMNTVEQMIKDIPTFNMECNTDEDAARLAFETVNKRG